MSECKCSMAISVNGDGCRYCQPQEYIDKLAERLEESRAEYSALEEKLSITTQCADNYSKMFEECAEERDAALAECERLRKEQGAETFLTLTGEIVAAKADCERLREFLRQSLDAMRTPYSDTRLQAKIDSALRAKP